ncbi:MAG: glycosyltransferase family 4 protein [candidate division Zixibacteria bacterium]|nr:glycosyltransferase family 4 protein [candidate division Zixibacteria bacterium]
MPNANTHNETPLKILFVTHNYIRFGGDFAGVFLHLLARKLGEQGIEVVVVAPHDASIPETEIIDGVKIHRFRYASDENETFAYRGDMHRQLFRNPFRIFRLLRFIRKATRLASKLIEAENISIVSTHWVIPNGMIAKRLKRKFGDRIKLVFSSHGTDVRLLTGVPLVLAYFKSIIRRAEAWTVVSRFLRDIVAAKAPSLGERIRILPLPNDEAVFYPDDSIAKDPNLIVATSRLTVQKRLECLIEAVKLVSKAIPMIRLEIYGTGPEKFKLERLIDEKGLAGRVVIKKPVAQEALREVYNRASVMVLNSIDEGFGLGLTEAMLCHTAVIGTDSGGIRDIIDHDRTGLLVPVDNAEALAAAIEKLLTDHTLRNRLEEAGYQKALTAFSSKATAETFAKLFREI